jgi:biotin transport system substrate-specific component
MALCGLSIALLSVGAAIQVPLGAIPFTLQTLMLFLLLLVLTPAEAVAAVGGYLVLGAVGLPVFSGLRGGFGVLLGPTGGFLLGYLVAALLVVLLRVLFVRWELGPRLAVALDVLLVAVAAIVYYAAGTWWFAFSTDTSLPAALAACVLPFLVPDVVKAAAAFACAKPIRVALGRTAPGGHRHRPVLPSESPSESDAGR